MRDAMPSEAVVPPLAVGQQRSRVCSGWHRRSFLQVGASTVLGLCWPRWLAVQPATEMPGSAASVRRTANQPGSSPSMMKTRRSSIASTFRPGDRNV